VEQTMAPPTPPRDQAGRPALHGTLLTRLWRRAEQPGCVRHGQARSLLARHQRMAGEPPLAGLLLRRGRGTDIQPSGPPIVAARPATAAPGAGPPRAPAQDPPRAPAPGARPSRASPPGTATPRDSAPRANALSAAPRPAVRARPVRPHDQPPSLPSPPRREPAAQPREAAAQPGAPRPNPAPSGVAASARPASAPPVVTASAARPVVTVPAARPVPGALARLVPGPAATPLGTGAAPSNPSAPPAGEVQRPVVRAGADGKAPTLAWPRPAPQQAGGTGGPARPPVPVVRERASPQGAWRPGPSVPQRPAMPQRPAIPQRSAPPLAGSTAAAPGPARTADPAGATRDPSRTPPEEPPGHRAGQREPARPAPPQIDMNRIVSTVQRRLTHHMAIERERRGMRR
jgi:hypothetical protein